jgi:HlyD family secretion protein
MENENNVSPEIRSEEIEDILEKAPNKIIRYGISVIFTVILVIVAGSWFFKYPDIITAPVIITSENIPQNIIAKTSGKIIAMLKKNNDTVSASTPIVLFESNADHNEVINLSERLLSISPSKEQIEINNIIDTITFAGYYKLGEIQDAYSDFIKSLNEIKNFNALNYYYKKIKSLQSQYEIIKTNINRNLSQQKILENDLIIAYKQFQRDSTLFSSKVISTNDYEKSESVYLQKKYSFEVLKSNMSNIQLQLSQVQQQILDLQLQYQEQSKKIWQEYNQAYELLSNKLNTWKQKYILISETDGIVSFTKYWTVSQFVKEGEKVLTIVPLKKGEIVCKANLKPDGIGKVKIGQKVNIQLAGYPYMEYGSLAGKISNISSVPYENFYTVEIELNKELKTNYNFQIPVSSEMQGTAEIITDDIRLINRLFNPIKSLIKKNR